MKKNFIILSVISLFISSFLLSSAFAPFSKQEETKNSSNKDVLGDYEMKNSIQHNLLIEVFM